METIITEGILGILGLLGLVSLGITLQLHYSKTPRNYQYPTIIFKIGLRILQIIHHLFFCGVTPGLWVRGEGLGRVEGLGFGAWRIL